MPEETRSAEKSWTLTAWRSSGELLASQGTRPYALQLHGSPYSFASALINEVQLLLDHAAEHRALVQTNIASGNDASPSWLFVTTYYWALFTALAFVRLFGRAAWYLDKEAMKSLVTGTTIKPPSAGTYILETGPVLGSSRREFLLKSSDDRFHEATWKLVADILRAHVQRVVADTTSGSQEQLAEIAIFKCVVEDPFVASNWPSTLRNAINYKPGFTYQSVHDKDLIENYQYYRSLSLNDWSSVVTQYNAISSTVRRNAHATTALVPATQLLALKAVILGELATRLSNEVIVERRLDRRWAAKRDRYLKRHVPNAGALIWPFSPP